MMTIKSRYPIKLTCNLNSNTLYYREKSKVYSSKKHSGVKLFLDFARRVHICMYTDGTIAKMLLREEHKNNHVSSSKYYLLYRRGFASQTEISMNLIEKN